MDDTNDFEKEEEFDKAVHVCEDCDYRWESKYQEEELESNTIICPMCGSMNLTQL